MTFFFFSNPFLRLTRAVNYVWGSFSVKEWDWSVHGVRRIQLKCQSDENLASCVALSSSQGCVICPHISKLRLRLWLHHLGFWRLVNVILTIKLVSCLHFVILLHVEQWLRFTLNSNYLQAV